MKLPRATLRPLLALALVTALSIGTAAGTAGTEARQQAPAAPALPAGVERVTSVEGHHRVSAAPNGLKVLLFPDPTKETITVNITYLVGSRHENYGETGMAHLLEHLVFKGTPKHPNIPQELTAHGARPNGTTWTDRTNYFETFAATDENLEWALDLEADRMVNSLHREEGSRQRDDRRAQRVRSGREQPVQRAAASGRCRRRICGTTTARRRSARAPTSRTCRSTGCRRSTSATTSRTTPCCSSPASSTRPKTLALVHKYFSPIPRPARVARTDLHHRADPGRRARRHAAARRRHAARRTPSTTCRPARTPDFAAIDVISPGARRHAVRPAAQGAGRVEEGGQHLRLQLPVARADDRHASAPRFGRDCPLDAARDTLLETIEGLSADPADEGGGRARPGPAAEEHRAEPQSLRPHRPDDERVHRRGRLAAVLPAPRPPAEGDDRGGAARRGQVPEAVESHARAVHPHRSSRIGPRFRRRRTSPRCSRTTRATRRSPPARRSIRRRRTSRRGRRARATPSGLKMALLPKKTRGGTVVAQLVLRYGDEKSLMNRVDRRVARRRRC